MSHKQYRRNMLQRDYLFPPSAADGLDPDHLVYFVRDLLLGLDISAIERAIQTKDPRGELGCRHSAVRRDAPRGALAGSDSLTLWLSDSLTLWLSDSLTLWLSNSFTQELSISKEGSSEIDDDRERQSEDDRERQSEDDRVRPVPGFRG